MISGYDEDRYIRKIRTKPDEKGAEQLHGFRRGDGSVVYVAGNDERRVGIPGQLLQQKVKHDLLVFEK